MQVADLPVWAQNLILVCGLLAGAFTAIKQGLKSAKKDSATTGSEVTIASGAFADAHVIKKLITTITETNDERHRDHQRMCEHLAEQTEAIRENTEATRAGADATVNLARFAMGQRPSA